jgi:hypothetical protein
VQGRAEAKPEPPSASNYQINLQGRAELTPQPVAAPSYSIILHTRHACVTPHYKKHARVDGGFIDVIPIPQGVTLAMTGTVAANSFLGCKGLAAAEFELVQEFEITCSDPKIGTVALTLDSTLVGFVRSKGHAAASMRLAEASVTPEGWDGTSLCVSYPPLGVAGKDGRLCNQHLPPVRDIPMPLGHYIIAARFALDTQAGGVCDDHSVADFSPDTSLPNDWVRMRDPFQGVSKKNFGFTFTLTAAPPSEPGLPVTSRPSASPAAAPSKPGNIARILIDPTTRRTSVK